MNREDCTIGQQVKITPHYGLFQRFEGLIGTIKETPLGFLVVQIDIPIMASEVEPYVEKPREFGELKP